MAAGAAACGCDEEAVARHLRSADWAFRARVLRAKITGSPIRRIQFTLELLEPIRGHPPATIDLYTTLPENCGIPITLGFSDLYVVKRNQRVVTACSASGRAVAMENHYLLPSLYLYELADTDRDKAVTSLQRFFYRSYPKKNILEFFEQLEVLDQSGAVIKSDNSISYRGIVFEFEDDKLKGPPVAK